MNAKVAEFVVLQATETEAVEVQEEDEEDKEVEADHRRAVVDTDRMMAMFEQSHMQEVARWKSDPRYYRFDQRDWA